MIPTNRTAPIQEAYSRALLDVSRVLESVHEQYGTHGIATAHDRSNVIARAALLCRVIARTLSVDPEATLLSVVFQWEEAIFDDG